MDPVAHWERVYSTKPSNEVSWFQARPARSLELLADVDGGVERRIIDVGGGDSSFVDEVVEHRLGSITVLDLSATALARAKGRLGAGASEVDWIEGDVTRKDLGADAYDVWHDRAVFHFLTFPDDRARYVATAAKALRRGGTLILATFAADGPTRCSGLDVARYDEAGLAREFESSFLFARGLADVHRTPSGAEQRFTYIVLRRR